MSGNSHVCELCGKRLVYLLGTVIVDKFAPTPSNPAAGTPCTKLETYHCPVNRDDECYPNSHYYLKVTGTGRLFYKEYHFDRFSVAVDIESNLTQIFDGSSMDYPAEPVMSLNKTLDLNQILRYYKTWILT